MSPDKSLPAPLRFLLPAFFWLTAWQLAAWAVDTELLLPGPLAAGRALCALALTPAFWYSAGASVLRILIGLLLGAVLGIFLALLTCASRWAALVLSPAVAAIRATPVASFILLVLLWVSRSAVPGVISALMVLPVIWSAVCQGVSRTDPLLLEMARAYRFGRYKTFRLIYVPSVLPQLAGGLNTAMGLAWKAGVAAEVICRPKLAAGTRIYNAKLALETPDLFAWTAAVVALSLLLERLMALLLRRVERKAGLRP